MIPRPPYPPGMEKSPISFARSRSSAGILSVASISRARGSTSFSTNPLVASQSSRAFRESGASALPAVCIYYPAPSSYS